MFEQYACDSLVALPQLECNRRCNAMENVRDAGGTCGCVREHYRVSPSQQAASHRGIRYSHPAYITQTILVGPLGDPLLVLYDLAGCSLEGLEVGRCWWWESMGRHGGCRAEECTLDMLPELLQHLQRLLSSSWTGAEEFTPTDVCLVWSM